MLTGCGAYRALKRTAPLDGSGRQRTSLSEPAAMALTPIWLSTIQLPLGFDLFTNDPFSERSKVPLSHPTPSFAYSSVGGKILFSGIMTSVAS